MFRPQSCWPLLLALLAVGGTALAFQNGGAPGPADASGAPSGEPPLSAAPFADGPRDNRDRLFQQLDRDADGTITLEEVPEPLRERLRPLFERLGKNALVRKDLDADGAPSRQAARAPRGPAIFHVLDEDADGRISREELSRAGEKFNTLDEDGSGAITLDEVFSLPGGFVRPEPESLEPESPGPESIPRESGRPARAPQPPAVEPRAGNGDLIERLFRRYDADRDGRLSREEAPAKLRQHFESFDASGDGQIDRDEFGAVVSRIQGEQAVDRRE